MAHDMALLSLADVNVASAGTAVAISTSNDVVASVTVQNKHATVNGYVGDSNVAAARGMLLEPGWSYTFEDVQLSSIYVDAASNDVDFGVVYKKSRRQ